MGLFKKQQEIYSTFSGAIKKILINSDIDVKILPTTTGSSYYQLKNCQKLNFEEYDFFELSDKALMETGEVDISKNGNDILAINLKLGNNFTLKGDEVLEIYISPEDEDSYYLDYLSVTTNSANVEVGEVVIFDFYVETISGNVYCDLCLERLHIATISGDINCDGFGTTSWNDEELVCKAYLETISGDVRVRINESNAELEYDFDTVSGDSEILYEANGKGEIAYISLEVKTISGDIVIE